MLHRPSPGRPRAVLPVLIAALLLLSACGTGSEGVGAASTADAEAELRTAAAAHTVTVHRTATCACCGEYEDELESVGFTVEQQLHDELAAVKDDFGIPEGEGSCHTNEVAGYAAEGHVPAEALLELIEQAPEVDGISLAGMPAGSPGMPGEQEEPFVVRSFVDGEVVGEFGRY
jgi:hypothetical protein